MPRGHTSKKKLWEKLKPRAREMRHEPTEAEARLWERLRNRQVNGVKFRRQYSIESFIVDFVALNEKLVIEVDGNVHEGRDEEDAIRQAFIEQSGFRVVRFRNEEVLLNIHEVISRIEDLTSNPSP